MIERKLLAHYLDGAEPGSNAASYERLGKDLEEYNSNPSATVDKKSNILGETSVKIHSYQKEGTVEPYYVEEENSALSERLQKIYEDNLELDDVASTEVDVKLWKPVTGSENTFEAVQYPVMIEVTSYGGDTSGFQIGFNIHYTGKGVKGTFNVSTKVFTANA